VSVPCRKPRFESAFISIGGLTVLSTSRNLSAVRFGAPMTVTSICGASPLVLGLVGSGGLTVYWTSMSAVPSARAVAAESSPTQQTAAIVIHQRVFDMASVHLARSSADR